MMPDDLFKKNMEMWEKFTSSYMDSMFKMVEKTMEQSQVFRSQVDRAVSEAVKSQMQATEAGLEALQRQVAALSEKLDQFAKKE